MEHPLLSYTVRYEPDNFPPSLPCPLPSRALIDKSYFLYIFKNKWVVLKHPLPYHKFTLSEVFLTAGHGLLYHVHFQVYIPVFASLPVISPAAFVNMKFTSPLCISYT